MERENEHANSTVQLPSEKDYADDQHERWAKRFEDVRAERHLFSGDDSEYTPDLIGEGTFALEDHAELTDFTLERALDNSHYAAVFQNQLEELGEAAKAQQQKLDIWKAKEEGRLQNRINWHLRLVQLYMTKAEQRTLRTPDGTAKRISGSERVEIEDVDRFVKTYLDDEELACLVSKKISYAPDKKAIKEHIKETGEVIEGAILVKGEESISFKGAR